MLIKVDFLHNLDHTWSCTHIYPFCFFQTIDRIIFPTFKNPTIPASYNSNVQLQNQGACQLK
jgi:hypothetical protein